MGFKGVSLNGSKLSGLPSGQSVKGAPSGGAKGQPKLGSGVPSNPGSAAAKGLQMAKDNAK